MKRARRPRRAARVCSPAAPSALRPTRTWSARSRPRRRLQTAPAASRSTSARRSRRTSARCASTTRSGNEVETARRTGRRGDHALAIALAAEPPRRHVHGDVPDHLRRLAPGRGRDHLLGRRPDAARHRRRASPGRPAAADGHLGGLLARSLPRLRRARARARRPVLRRCALVAHARRRGRRRRGMGAARRRRSTSGARLAGRRRGRRRRSRRACSRCRSRPPAAAGTRSGTRSAARCSTRSSHTRFGDADDPARRGLGWCSASSSRSPRARADARDAAGRARRDRPRAEPPGQPRAGRAADAADRLAAHLPRPRRPRPHAGARPGCCCPPTSSTSPAMCLWLGGLAALAVARPRRAAPARRRRTGRACCSARSARFSPIALASVIALAAPGRSRRIVEVGGVRDLVRPATGARWSRRSCCCRAHRARRRQPPAAAPGARRDGAEAAWERPLRATCAPRSALHRGRARRRRHARRVRAAGRRRAGPRLRRRVSSATTIGDRTPPLHGRPARPGAGTSSTSTSCGAAGRPGRSPARRRCAPTSRARTAGRARRGRPPADRPGPLRGHGDALRRDGHLDGEADRRIRGSAPAVADIRVRIR